MAVDQISSGNLLEDRELQKRVDGQTIQLGGKSSFDIREFGLQPPRMLLLKMEPEVEIRIEVFAVRES